MRLLNKIKSNSLLKKSLADTNYYLISQVAAKLLTILVIPFLARVVTVEDFGSYDAFLLYSSFLLVFATLGIDSGIGVFIVESKGKEHELSFYYTISLILGSLTIVILFALGSFVQSIYPIIPALLFKWIFINLFFSFISYTAFNFLRWMGKSKVAAIVTFFSTTLGVLLGVLLILILNSSNIVHFIIGLIIGNLVCAVICLILTRQYFRLLLLDEFKSKIGDIFKVSLPFLPNYLVNNLLLLSDRFLILHFLNPVAYGHYSIIARISQIPAFGIQVINKGFLPVLFQNHNTDEGRSFNRKIFHLYLLLILPLLLFFMMADKMLVQLFAGKQYVDVAYLVPSVMLSVIFFGTMGFNGFGFSIRRKTLQITIITIVSVILNVSISLLLIKKIELSAISIAIMITAAITSFAYTYFSERLFKIGYNQAVMIVVYAISTLIALIYTLYYHH